MNTIFDRIWEQKTSFFLVFFIVFTLSYLVLMAVDFLPEAPAIETETESVDTENMAQTDRVPAESADSLAVDELSADTEVSAVYGLAIGMVDEYAVPTSLYIPKLDKTVAVLNPASRSIADLDTALLDGVVRHPDSATLNQEGNVFILGHSSYLPVVLNKNFQAFNGIQNLEWGDTIEVSSDTAVYTYRVEKVYRANAQEVTVPIAGAGHKLTLATCNSFGSTDDRYIVEASRVDVTVL